MPEALWRALETVPAEGRILAEWRLELGGDFWLIQPFLRPTDHIGKTHRCPSPGGGGCPRQILRINPKEYFAVCGDVPIYCDEIKLGRAEVIAYELDLGKLAEALAKALGFEASLQPTPDYRTHRLGLWLPQTNARWPIYLTLPYGGGEFRQSASSLLFRDEGPFILLSPAPRDSELETITWLEQKGAHYLSLSRALSFGEEGGLLAEKTLVDLFQDSAEPEYAFRRRGDLWHITFQGKTQALKHRKGFSYIARVLAAPEQECHVRDLVQAEAGQTLVIGSAGEVADSQAIQAYEMQKKVLIEELQSSEVPPSDKRIDEILDEVVALEKQLNQSQGLGGRHRVQRDDQERMRNSVRRAIQRAIRDVEGFPSLARHLKTAFSFGVVISYRPDKNLEWRLLTTK